MRRYLPILVLVAAPILGIVIATAIAWQVYPQRVVPADASHAESRRIGNQMFEDASARSQYMLWGGIGGAAVGLIGAISLIAVGKKRTV